MTNFAKFLAEDRRLVILRVLAELPGYRTNSFCCTPCWASSATSPAPTRSRPI